MTEELDFDKDYILEDEMVSLRPLHTGDKKHLIKFAIEEPEIWTYSLVEAAGEKGMESYITAALKAREEKKEYPFIVFDKRTNEYAGCTRFYDVQLTNKTLQLGYTWYGKNFQGTGLNKHCKFLLLALAFEKIGIERVEFRADFNNKKSIAAMQSIGCTVEGVLRSHAVKLDGTRRDSIILSIVKDEWLETAKSNLLLKLS